MRANIRLVKNRIRSLAITIALFAGLIVAPPVNAVQGGEVAAGDGVVVALLNGRTSVRSFCSGALLQPRLVVTAAHCVIRDSVPINFPNSLFVATPGADLNRDDISTRARVTEVNWVRGFQNSSTSIEPNDFAVLVLDKPIGTPVITRLATAQEIKNLQGDRGTVTHLGYGKLTLERDNDGIPRKIDLRVRPTAQGFPYPTGSTINTTGTSTESICPGDSGGPIVTRIRNELVLVGVNAGGDTSCISSYRGTNTATGMVASFYQNIIDQGIADIANSAPAEPTEVKYEISGGEVAISWRPPAFDSASVTGYRVEEVIESKRAFLGVYVEDATGGGVLISSIITDTPADYAKLESLDVILAVGGVSVANTDAMLVEMRKRKVGDLVTFRIRKGDGQTRDVAVRLSEVGDPTGANRLCQTSSTEFRCQVKLNPGKTKYRVYALSNKGDGTAYDFSVENGPGGPPSNIRVVAKAGNLEVTWANPLRVSSIARSQLKVRVLDSKLEQILCNVPLTDYRCVIPALVSSYQLAIMVDSPLGLSERIELAEVVVQPASPARVNKVKVAKVSGNLNYVVSWQAPANNGGSPITSYRVISPSGLSLCRVSAPITKCTIKANQVKPGAKIQVIAVNDVGESQPRIITVPR